MKIVINRCFGGFGISYKAKLALLETPCTHIELVDYGDSAYSGSSMEAFYKELASGKKPDSYSNYKDNKFISDKHDYSEARTCKYLIETIEKLGKESYGDCSKLEIIEIPEGISYQVDDYDGMESIEETHRSWR